MELVTDETHMYGRVDGQLGRRLDVTPYSHLSQTCHAAEFIRTDIQLEATNENDST